MSQEYLSRLFGLDGQVIVVIGGTGVLGGALAEGLAGAGATIVVAGRSAERGEQRAAAIRQAGGQASFASVDVYSGDSIRQLHDAVQTQYGRIDGLVNCAGVNSATPYEEIPLDEWERILHGNLTATHLACQVFAPTLAAREQGGAILNIGSVTAHLPLSRVFAYSASKAAVVNLTQNLAREYAPHKVRVNVLCPGFFPAEQNRRILDQERIDNILRNTPLGRFGEPEELVGMAVLLMSSKAGSFITGGTYYVDGGFTSNRF